MGTVNGLENEGMRNFATHISKELSKTNQVREVGLRQVFAVACASLWADSVLICARASGKTFTLTKLICLLNKNTSFLFVQRADETFVKRYNDSGISVRPFCVSYDDVSGLKNAKEAELVEAGIDVKKFSPVCPAKANELKARYGLEEELPTVVHVGHCSEGRGLEDFLALPKGQYNRLVYASGMFENEGVRNTLESDGVKVVSEFNPSIQEVYQLADVYLFPTQSTEFVISVPLSVMEALSCGTPVVAYDRISGLGAIRVTDQEAVSLVRSSGEIEGAVASQLVRKAESSYLAHPRSWAEVAQRIEQGMEERC